MNLEDLKEALMQLAKEQPEFVADLIEETVRSRLRIASVDDGDYYKPGTTYALEWSDTMGGSSEFTRAS